MKVADVIDRKKYDAPQTKKRHVSEWSDTLPPFHIIDEWGYVEGSNNYVGGKTSVEITRCNRLIRHKGYQTLEEKDVPEETFCSRCGTPDDFIEAIRQRERASEQRQHENDLKYAEQQRDWMWARVGRAINDQIMEEVRELAKNPTTKVCLSLDQVLVLMGESEDKTT